MEPIITKSISLFDVYTQEHDSPGRLSTWCNTTTWIKPIHIEITLTLMLPNQSSNKFKKCQSHDIIITQLIIMENFQTNWAT